MELHVLKAESARWFPSQLVPRGRHIPNQMPCMLIKVIRTKFKVINIYSDKLEGLVSTMTKIQPQPNCRDETHI